MNLYKRVISIEDFKPKIFNLYPFGDTHMRTRAFDKKAFEDFLKEVENDPMALTIANGDLIEDDSNTFRERRKSMFIDRSSFELDEDDAHKRSLDIEVIPYFFRLAKAGLGCLGLLDGDHFRRYQDGTTSTQYICQKTGIPYLGERTAYVGLVFRSSVNGNSIRYVIHIQHGVSGSQTLGGDINSLVKYGTGFRADLYVGGHTHKGWGLHSKVLEVNPSLTGIMEKKISFVRAGSFRKGYEIGRMDYSEREGYMPIHTGWCKVSITVAKDSGFYIKDVKITS